VGRYHQGARGSKIFLIYSQLEKKKYYGLDSLCISSQTKEAIGIIKIKIGEIFIEGSRQSR
jgi:hypothetical protein